MTPFTERVITLIKKIPEGKVATYGQLAKLAGSPRGARQVARLLHSMSRKHGLPWHRVINSKGQISLSEDAFLDQKLSLEAEGVEVSEQGKIHMETYQWTPEMEG
ncbi:DNA methyltransferase [Pontibacillus halophilus JSM 076056 = DSM 19796]|uniref:DNA methyltransferase n=1 Tax=Pontibacillus halophilus JSM 076056 = DSM 19796 TaxID=1385510 RepID=A0A0A5GN50_9BACI|nr:MGMT family protein [Pontibacillus halophilus]KGX92570.1 DNA methyltransferase [Pontibacillus halophilus JSM 076056 = DSM 19796]